MFVRDLRDCKVFVAGDNTLLRELLHPDKQQLQIRYSLAHAMLSPGKASTPHRLKTSEVYYILKGCGTMFIDAETMQVHSGQAIYIPPHAKQHIENSGKDDLMFLCVVDPAWRPEDEDVL